MNCKRPRVSVVIPTKDRLDLLHRAITSIKEQSYQDIELIVVDDFSNEQVTNSYIEKYVGGLDYKLIRNEKKFGGAKSRNVGVEHSSGDFICFLDDDDLFMFDKVETLVNILISNQNIDFCFGKVLLNDGRKKWEPISYPASFCLKTNFTVGNYIHTSSTLIRRQVFRKVRFNESLNRYQDTQFHLELSLKFKGLFVDKIVSEWSVDNRDDQITSNNTKAKKQNSFCAQKALISYLKDELSVNEKNLSYFRLYQCKLAFNVGLLQGLINAASLVKYPTAIIYAPSVIFLRWKIFKK